MIDLRQTFKQVPEDAREHCMEFLEDLIKRGFAGPEFMKVWSQSERVFLLRIEAVKWRS